MSVDVEVKPITELMTPRRWSIADQVWPSYLDPRRRRVAGAGPRGAAAGRRARASVSITGAVDRLTSSSRCAPAAAEALPRRAAGHGARRVVNDEDVADALGELANISAATSRACCRRVQRSVAAAGRCSRRRRRSRRRRDQSVPSSACGRANSVTITMWQSTHRPERNEVPHEDPDRRRQPGHAADRDPHPAPGRVDDHDLVEAADGRRGLRHGRAESPDLVLSDWNMPEMTGIECLGRCAPPAARCRSAS